MEQFANAAVSTLNGAITSGSTSLVVASAALFPTTGNFRILVETEIMLVTAVSGTTFTVTRAQESTTAGAHNNGVLVAHVVTAGGISQSISEHSQGGRVAPDANDVIVWAMQESSGNFLNTGSGATDSLQDIGATPITKQASGLVLPYAASMCANGGTQTLSTATGAGTDTANEPAFPLSISAWIKVFQINNTGNFRHVVDKIYRPISSGWSSPFTVQNFPALGISGNSAGLELANGSLSAPCLGLGDWHHIGGTYDGTTISMYCDGVLVASAALSAAVDYGSHGPWIIGRNPANGSEDNFYGQIHDVRVANVARAASYFRTVYRTGMGLSLP